MFGGHAFGEAYFGGGTVGATETRAVCATVTLTPVLALDAIDVQPAISAAPLLAPVIEATPTLTGDC